MAANKTTENANSVDDFIKLVKDDTKRADSLILVELIKKTTCLDPKMWGPSIIGFGSYHYKYESGREGEAPLVGFSPRAAALTLYLSGNFEKRDEFLTKLGKHKTDKGCIYFKKLGDINLEILENMIQHHILHLKRIYPEV